MNLLSGVCPERGGGGRGEGAADIIFRGKVKSGKKQKWQLALKGKFANFKSPDLGSPA